jgi:hypothetical protein
MVNTLLVDVLVGEDVVLAPRLQLAELDAEAQDLDHRGGLLVLNLTIAQTRVSAAKHKLTL